MSLPSVRGEVARLCDEVDLRFLPSGKAVAKLSLAFNKRKKNEAGEWEDAGTLFIRATAWEQLAENCAESLSKGTEVIVTGELSMDEYERKDGTKGSTLKMNIYAIGPSLARSTAKVAKAARSGTGSGYGSATPVDDPWTSAPTIAAAAAGDYDDEPPPF